MSTDLFFDPYSDVFYDHPYELYKQLRDQAPVSYNPKYNFYALARYADVVEASRDHETYSNRWGAAPPFLANTEPAGEGPGNMLFMDPPNHERMRKLVNRAFTPRAAQNFEHIVRRVIKEKADAIGSAKNFDWVADFVALFPVEVICSILGIPSKDHQTIRHWVDESLTIDPLNPPDETFLTRTGTLYMYILEFIKEKRKSPSDDMMSQLIETRIDDDGSGDTRPLSDDEIAGFSLLIASAGAETVTKLLGSTAYLLDKNPDQWSKLKANPTLIPKAIDEANRYFAPSQYQGRHAMKDVSLHGVDIPAGSGVVLLTAAATRDERQFPDPDRFDIDRDVPVQISFGHGIHYCLGVYLAKLECKVAMETLIERWPNFSIDHANAKRVRMSNVAGFCNLPTTVS